MQFRDILFAHSHDYNRQMIVQVVKYAYVQAENALTADNCEVNKRNRDIKNRYREGTDFQDDREQTRSRKGGGWYICEADYQEANATQFCRG